MNSVLPFPKELQPKGIRQEIVTPVLEGDDRLWVPIHDNVWFKPLLLNITHGTGPASCECGARASSAVIAIPRRCMDMC